MNNLLNRYFKVISSYNIIGYYRHFVVFSKKCPKCSSNIIENNNYVECGAINCDYVEIYK